MWQPLFYLSKIFLRQSWTCGPKMCSLKTLEIISDIVRGQGATSLFTRRNPDGFFTQKFTAAFVRRDSGILCGGKTEKQWSSGESGYARNMAGRALFLRLQIG